MLRLATSEDMLREAQMDLFEIEAQIRLLEKAKERALERVKLYEGAVSRKESRP